MSDAAGVQQFAVEQMPVLLAALRGASRLCVADDPVVPNTPGIYMFSEAGTPIYVGQSRKLRSRLKQHTGANHGRDQASFAFNVARREAADAGVDIKRFRSVLEADSEFAPHFDAARASVARMDVQFIEVSDPIVRALFEVYAASRSTRSSSTCSRRTSYLPRINGWAREARRPRWWRGRRGDAGCSGERAR